MTEPQGTTGDAPQPASPSVLVSRLKGSLRSSEEPYPTNDVMSYEGSLPDPRLYEGLVEAEILEFSAVSVRYVGFQVLSYWGLGGGLQYFHPTYIAGGITCSQYINTISLQKLK